MIGQIRELSAEAKSVGIATVIWSYPRGGILPKSGELALDVGARRRGQRYMAALWRTHHQGEAVERPATAKEAKPMYEGTGLVEEVGTVRHVVQSSLAGLPDRW